MIPSPCLGKVIAIVGYLVKHGTWACTHTKLYQSNREFLTSFEFSD